MGSRAATAFLAAALLAALPASAQKRPDLDGPSQFEMNQQAAARYRIADQALNTAYRKMMAEASPSGRQRLQAAQRAWVAFRDLDCEARAGSRGGSFHPAAVSLCLEQVTDERTKTLKAEMSCVVGDVGCGGHLED